MFLLFTIKEQEIVLIMCERFIFMEIKKKGDHTCKSFSLSFFFFNLDALSRCPVGIWE